jgi:dihydropteroate synthase
MGVLNVTPDSFSDGGRFDDPAAAIDRARALIDAGADLVDIGGESTRPGAAPVSVEEELRRVMPVVEKCSVFSVQCPVGISIDTSRADVAKAALAAGARVVNDISALRGDERMVDLVREAGAGLVLMHMQGTPRTMQQDPGYRDVLAEVRMFLADRIELAVRGGIPRERIAVDPGIGFGKTVAHNLELLAGLDSFRELGCPVLVGTSRKSFIGKVLDREVDQRAWGTAATVAWAVAHGARIVRVHDVREMSDVVRMIESIVKWKSGGVEE